MATWRMSFRAGNKGPKMWPNCLQLNVAAITYDPLAKTDLSKYPVGSPQNLWSKLRSTQKSSLRRVGYEMKGGDVIYAKQGPKIVAKGIVQGQKKGRAYRFDSKFRIVDPYGVPWAHQVPLAWTPSPDTQVLLCSDQL